MTDQTASERLQALIRNNSVRSKTARFRELLPDIEAALAAGVSRKAIIDELAQSDLVLTPAAFKNYLQRSRGKQSPPPEQPAAPATRPAAPGTQPAAPATPSPATESMTLAEVMNAPIDMDALKQAGREARKK